MNSKKKRILWGKKVQKHLTRAQNQSAGGRSVRVRLR